MAKNKLGGNKAKRSKKNSESDKRELVFKEPEQEYGQVQSMLGNGRCLVNCMDGVQRLCHIRGKMRKKVWVNQGDIVLVSLRDFQDEKADIILKYSSEEARNLKAYKELSEGVRINETDIVDGDLSSDGVEFVDTAGIEIADI
uniref:Eukaryotic translation initiation factor 4C n=1 Tax=Noctiluca scintillans TaxID=2966 RepID=A0A7S1FBP3_NOCSC|mmetsp:Transcript_48165/g.127549  ORF Transcript_48165/g.127549 Transcript_48165/m.127549 type:complete len:143 (+) Transcript_48165:39-467(+)|eukprot:CAMPEP_0194502752 /NCGR_PEP_ID=MMETSP0253-20130528/26940_1 /TAXON_ID=2966 /ORGANISM="Noctiluca scintillans" /LENGTH=142 /DNA_ID=CAMNT_0039344963 /DNA_START=39 /DNA_END=467 /DNA_ORIENTATION=+